MEKIFYFAQVLSGLNVLFVISAIVLGIASLVLTIGVYGDGFGLSNEPPMQVAKLKSITKKVILVAVLSVLSAIFVPSKKTYLFMVGGRYIDSVISENPEIQELPKNTIELLNEYIKAETEKLREEK